MFLVIVSSFLSAGAQYWSPAPLVSPQDSPNIAKIYARSTDNKVGNCTGIRVTKSIVLTAGHCISAHLYHRPWVQLVNHTLPKASAKFLGKSLKAQSAPVTVEGHKKPKYYIPKGKMDQYKAVYGIPGPVVSKLHALGFFRPLFSVVDRETFYDQNQHASSAELSLPMVELDLALLVFGAGRSQPFKSSLKMPRTKFELVESKSKTLAECELKTTLRVHGRGRLPLKQNWSDSDSTSLGENHLAETHLWEAKATRTYNIFNNSRQKRNTAHYLLIDERIPGGNSGSPVFTRDGSFLKGIFSKYDTSSSEGRYSYSSDFCDLSTREHLCRLVSKLRQGLSNKYGRYSRIYADVNRELAFFKCSKVHVWRLEVEKVRVKPRLQAPLQRRSKGVRGGRQS